MSEFPIKLFQGQANFIKTLRYHPCADPFPILVETFFPCVLRMAVDLYLLDEQDIAMDVLEKYPRYGKGKPASRGYRHNSKRQTTKGPRTRKKVKAVPFIKKPFTKGLTTFLFHLAKPVEQVGFVFMFYSAVDNFFYNWSSLLIRRGYCELPALTGPLTLKANPGVQLASASGEPVSLAIEHQNRASWPHSSTAAVLPPGTYVVTWTARLKNNLNETKFPVRLVLKEGVFPVTLNRIEGEAVSAGPDSEISISVSGVVGSPTFLLNDVWWEIESVGAPLVLLDLLESTLTIWQDYEEISY